MSITAKSFNHAGLDGLLMMEWAMSSCHVLLCDLFALLGVTFAFRSSSENDHFQNFNSQALTPMKWHGEHCDENHRESSLVTAARLTLSQNAQTSIRSKSVSIAKSRSLTVPASLLCRAVLERVQVSAIGAFFVLRNYRYNVSPFKSRLRFCAGENNVITPSHVETCTAQNSEQADPDAPVHYGAVRDRFSAVH